MNDTFTPLTLADIFGEPLSTYSRRQAIDDGVLIDVTSTATEAGFRIPVAITAAAWADCVEWTDADSKRQCYQDQPGRLWDVIWMASQTARRNDGAEIRFQLYRVARGQGTRPRLVALKAICGPGDDAEPVVTIMLPDED